MALGDIVQQSSVGGGSSGFTISLPGSVGTGNRVLLITGAGDSGDNPVPLDGDWTIARREGTNSGQARRVIIYMDDDNPTSVEMAAHAGNIVAQLVEFEGLGGALVESGSMTTGFSNDSPLPIELDDEISENAGLVAAFVTGNAARAFDNSSWTGGYSHGDQIFSGIGASEARIIWGYRGTDDTTSDWPTSVSYADDPPQSSGVVVAFAELDSGDPEPLDTPTNFTFTAHASVRQLDGSWDAVENADSYEYQVDYDDDGTWTPFAGATQAGTSFQLDDGDGVDWATTYRARVRAVTT